MSTRQGLARVLCECYVNMVSAMPLDGLQLHVPLRRTRFIGRDIGRATARKLLLDDTTPLLTLTAP